jgi:hypothetical protein
VNARRIDPWAQQKIAERLHREAVIRSRVGWAVALLAMAFVGFKLCGRAK